MFSVENDLENQNMHDNIQKNEITIEDKTYIVDCCNVFMENAKEIEQMITPFVIDNLTEITEKSKDILEYNETVTQAEVDSITTKSSSINCINTLFRSINMLVPSLSYIPFFTLYGEQLKKYCEQNLHNIDYYRSNYFWDNILCDANKTISKYDTVDIDIINIYDFFEKLCDKTEIPGLYEKIEQFIDNVFTLYNEFMHIDNLLNIKRDNEKVKNDLLVQEEKEKDIIKNENYIMIIINIIIPIIILVIIVCVLISSFSIITLLMGIGAFIWLCGGIMAKFNSCKKCGKWNSYVIIDQEVVDTYVTTENRSIYKNGRYDTYPVTVTKQNVILTLKCKKCGNIKYKNVVYTK